MSSPESRPEFKAAEIQAKADGLDPIHEAVRESYRTKIMAVIARVACAPEKPGESES